MNKNYIGIATNGGPIINLFQINEETVSKRNVKVEQVEDIDIFLTDEAGTTSEKLGHITWPREMEGGRLCVTYKPKDRAGEVELLGTDYIWVYTLDENPVPKETKAKQGSAIDKDEVNRRRQKKKEARIFYADQLLDEWREHVFGQEEGLRDMAEMIAANSRKKTTQCLVMAILGKTGIGKSECAKALAKILTELTGIEYGYLKIALNMFRGEHYASMFTGSPSGYVGYGGKTVLDPVRKNPYYVIELSEFEKATPEILESLMELFDTGELMLADNSGKIDCGRCIFIPTCNILVDEEEYAKVSPFQKREMARNALTDHFHKPEIAGRMRCLSFQSLSDNVRMEIIEKCIREELSNFDMILDEVDPDFVEGLIDEQTIYGARAVRGMVEDALKQYLAYDRDMNRFANKHVRLNGTVENMQIQICS